MLDLPLVTTDRVLKWVRLCRITRDDGEIFRIAEAQQDVTADSETFVPVPGLRIGAIKHMLGSQPSSVEIVSAIYDGGTIELGEVVDGKFDNALVEIYAVDLADIDVPGLMFSGRIGPIQFSSNSEARFDTRGHSVKTRGPFIPTYGPMCRTDLGSVLCKIPIRPTEIARNTAYALGTNLRVNTTGGSTPDKYSDRFFEVTTAGTTTGTQPSYNTTIGATTTDGTAVLTARNAWTRAARVGAIIDQFSFTLDRDPDARAVDNWFNQGAIRMHDGYSATRAFEVARWVQSSKKVTLYLPIAAANNSTLFAAGDWLEIWRGCDFTINTCATVFANSKNFRGEPHFAGAALAALQVA